MLYIKRDSDYQIVAIFNKPQADAQEPTSLENPDVIEFLSSCESAQQVQLLQSDLQLIRVIEDLVQILLDKNIISITDFPTTVIEKLVERRGIRSKIEPMYGIIKPDMDTEN